MKWTEVLPEGKAKPFAEEDWNGIPPQAILDSSLQSFYSAHLEQSDCREIVASDTDLPLLIWIDSVHRGLVIGASLPHVVEACAEHVALSADAARHLGFSDEFLRSIGD